MNQPLVSIILPVYNAQSHIARCLQSIRRQTYQNLEIIVVNDGSKDVSLSVCEMYARVDKRIILVDKANSGVSATRNLAIEMATGKYLQFVDSDDYLDPNATRLMVEKAEESQADMVISHYFRVDHEKDPDPEAQKLAKEAGEKSAVRDVISRYGFLEEGFYTKIEFAKNLMQEPASFYYGVMWNKLYRRDMVMSHNIRCSEELTWSEDLLFNLEYIRYAARFYALETPIYYYVNNPNSFLGSHLTIKNTITTKANLFVYYKALYEEMGLYEENKLQIYKYLVATCET